MKARVQAKPIEGQANEAIRKFLAKAAGVSNSRVTLVRGSSSRDKDLRILWPEGTDASEIEEAERRIRAIMGVSAG